MRLRNNWLFSISIVVFLICACFSPVLAQEGSPEIDVDGRPAGTQPGPVPAQEPPAPASVPASDQDEGDITALDVIHADDVIVDGGLCVGVDCATDGSEGFSFITIKMKENNTRLRFDDTSTTGSFPSNDWQITANDSANGGQSYLAIDDITGGKTPFKVEAGARTDTIHVDDQGRVGLRTADPVEDLHVVWGDTPTVRLDQQNWWGWGTYVWDVAANEANFFIRDVTGGYKHSFRIKPGAPTNSVYIASDGDIGMGTDSPGGPLNVERSNVDILLLDDNGNLAITGALTEMSDAACKENFAPVDGGDVLARLAEVPVQSWNYKGDDPSARHVGPTAQDFHAAFGLGQDDQHIAPLDTNGVALAAIQELYRQVQALKQENAELRAQVARLQ